MTNARHMRTFHNTTPWQIQCILESSISDAQTKKMSHSFARPWTDDLFRWQYGHTRIKSAEAINAELNLGSGLFSTLQHTTWLTLSRLEATLTARISMIELQKYSDLTIELCHEGADNLLRNLGLAFTLSWRILVCRNDRKPEGHAALNASDSRSVLVDSVYLLRRCCLLDSVQKSASYVRPTTLSSFFLPGPNDPSSIHVSLNVAFGSSSG